MVLLEAFVCVDTREEVRLVNDEAESPQGLGWFSPSGLIPPAARISRQQPKKCKEE